MKITAVTQRPSGLPPELDRWIADAPLWDSSSSPSARVYFLDKDRGYYLKTSAKGALAKEAEMTAYFHSKGFGTAVLDYCSLEKDWLLTERVPGEDCASRRYLAHPLRLCDTVAIKLRELHETDFTDCPVTDRTTDYLTLAEKNYRAGCFDRSLFPDDGGFRTAKEAYAILEEGKNALQRNALLHGDACLPNLLLEDWHFSAFIDLGNGGVGDRHIDLFWGLWSLWYNLKTDRYSDRFLDAYGRDKVDPFLLRVVAAAETFG